MSTVLVERGKHMYCQENYPASAVAFPCLRFRRNFPHFDDYMRTHVLLKTAVEEGSCQSRGNVPFLYEEAFILLLSAADKPV